MAKALTVPSLSSPTQSPHWQNTAEYPKHLKQATGAHAHLKNADLFHRTCGAVHIKNLNAATIAGRQVYLSWQYIAKRQLNVPT
jgi:hypothetical protein